MLPFFATVCALVAVVCFGSRLPALLGNGEDSLAVFAMECMMPQARTSSPQTDSSSTPSSSAATSSIPENSSLEVEEEEMVESSSLSSLLSSQASSSTDGKVTYPILECHIGASGTQYNNFYMISRNSVDINIGEELKLEPDIHISKNGEPQVLILHTHTCESYMEEDLGYYYEDYYPRNTDNNYNVTQVGEAIAEKLEAAGIGVIHDTTQHDNPSYNGSYARSEATAQKYLDQYPSIQVIIDVHRDALENDEKQKTKPTFVANGKKAAQIMIMSGCDEDGTQGFPDWELNLRFALRLQQTAENMYPGMTRPLYFCSTNYNMDLTHGSILVEVGTDSNTLDEAVYAGSLFGDVLVSVLNDLEE